ncbi:hypothetical protein [Ruegeria arenilitoris]|uniref:hypothetical protein n=1 Tax=Ruegeria arenilitoris TaxID=1173585 RepID=UPI00147B6CF1|nr:hypothetical protein [Ruegeria arenilitoris]
MARKAQARCLGSATILFLASGETLSSATGIASRAESRGRAEEQCTLRKTTQKKQTEMIGLRVDRDLFATIKAKAEENGISPTSFARILIAEALGYSENLPRERARRRRSKKPVPSELRKAVQVLALLIDISADLKFLAHSFREMSAREQVSGSDLESARVLLAKSYDGVTEIRTRLLGRAQ